MQFIFSDYFHRINKVLENFLYHFSLYSIPILIGFLSILSLSNWPSPYTVQVGSELKTQIVYDSTRQLHPLAASEALESERAVKFKDTKLKEAPFWLQFTVPATNENHPKVVEFPSRHTNALTCWNAQSFTRLGGGNRKILDGSVFLSKTGFALSLMPSTEPQNIVCRTESKGPGTISVLLWNSSDFQQSELEFRRRSGLLDGGLAVLCIFVALTALINRSKLYLLFSVWLAINLRMAELSIGSDTQWMGSVLPVDIVARTRLITTGLYYLVTIVLFSVLFKDDLNNLKSLRMFRFAQWTCIPIVSFSVILDNQYFLPLLWLCTAFNITVLVYYLSRILIKTRSRVAIWYGIGLSITLFASFSEVVAASMGLKMIIGSVNSVTAALSSSLLTALAIAEHIRQEHEQRKEVQAELTQTFNAMPIGMFTLDVDGHFLSANPALMDMLGQDVVAANARWGPFFEDGAWTRLHGHTHDRRAARTEYRAHMGVELRSAERPLDKGARAPVEFETRSALAPGEENPRRFLVKAALTRGKIQGSLQDVTEKSRATDELYFLANHDSLTKVLNRRGLELAMHAALSDLPAGKSMSMAYLDLDRFKLINDMFGHAVGDEVLQQVCLRVSELLPTGMSIGRVGGDEFVIVFAHTPLAMAEHMCKGILDSIGTQPYRSAGSAFYVRGSVGLIEVDMGMKLKDALSGADRACQQAKLANRGGLMVFHKQSSQFLEHEAQLLLIAQLASSAPNAGLYLEMQPLMSLNDPSASLDFEVLLRMRNQDGTQVPTERLLGAAQASGRMGIMDLWVLTSTLSWLNQHRNELTKTRFACVNFSGASLNDEQFLAEVYELLETNRNIVHMVCLEITESVALNDIENTRRFVNKVRRIGARVALDDFGAGYTSFAYLKEITADILKIDGSFVLDMNKHPANLAIVETIVSLAKSLGMKVIAEWVEDHATLQTLAEIGVDYAQGFVVSKSLPPEAILNADSALDFLTPHLALDLTALRLTHLAPTGQGAFALPARMTAI